MLRSNVQQENRTQSATHSPHLNTLITNRLDACESTLRDLEDAIAPIAPELTKTYETLVSILRSLAQCNTRTHVGVLLQAKGGTDEYLQFPEKEVKQFKEQLKEMETGMVGGHFVNRDGEPVTGGEDVVIALLKRCQVWADLVLDR
jgi:Protein of unknown function (DUF2408)